MPTFEVPEFAQEQRKTSTGEEAYQIAGMILPVAKKIGLELDLDATATIISDVMRWIDTKWKP